MRGETGFTHFPRILIANRGEIALRAVQVCRRLGIESVAVFSSADAGAAHALAADAAVKIGPAPSRQSYLNQEALLHVAVATGCKAVYPGYGFLAENAGFAERCRAEGLVFVGPDPETIRLMGDKSAARATAARLGVPVVQGSEDAFASAAQAEEAARAIGVPLLLKARAGGGGRGMRIVTEMAALAAQFEESSREAQAAFGDGGIYVEKFFPAVRHIEVQVLADGHGSVACLGERDCTVQRRHQKLVEEAPSPALDDATRLALMQAAERLCLGSGYRGAGTVEFIYDEGSRAFYFIEMNARIQVEHPVTEMRTGADLVAAQLAIAAGARLEDCIHARQPDGHAIEFRINAEDWRRDFRPSPGTVTRWRPPAGDGIRLDTASHENHRISPHYDSMIGKLIVFGADRAEAIRKAEAALAAFTCDGVETTIGFHRALLRSEAFRRGKIDTRWVEREFLAGDRHLG